ncbi:MAG: membrane dipeptidase [Planctomycetota bacterium]
MRADLHVDTLWRLEEKGGGLSTPREDLHIDAQRCRSGRIRLLCTAVFTEDNRQDPWQHCCRLLDVKDRLSADVNEPFLSITTPAQLEDLPVGVTGMLATIENALCLEGQIGRLEQLHERGVRILGICWNGANQLGQGVLQDDGQGLTVFGKQAVTTASELGWAIDVSHLNREGVLDVCDLGVPVVATHSNARHLHDHPRNLSDELLQRLADCGGLVGINVFPPFLGPSSKVISIDDVVEHMLYVMGYMGERRVSLGTDLDGIAKMPEGFRDYRDLDRIENALAEAGVAADVIQSVLGQGFVDWWRTWSE